MLSFMFLDQSQEPPSSLIGTIKKLQSGYIAGTRVHLGNLSDFVSTSCVTKLSFLENPDVDSGMHCNKKSFNIMFRCFFWVRQYLQVVEKICLKLIDGYGSLLHNTYASGPLLECINRKKRGFNRKKCLFISKFTHC